MLRDTVTIRGYKKICCYDFWSFSHTQGGGFRGLGFRALGFRASGSGFRVYLGFSGSGVGTISEAPKLCELQKFFGG